jgi:hypothetical protein
MVDGTPHQRGTKIPMPNNNFIWRSGELAALIG